MIDAKYTQLLVRYGTDTRPHSGRSLLDHLVATYELLEQWGNDSAVCLAGLCHSIYGTAHFKVQSAQLDSRRDIAAVIGARAEELAYLFCVVDRAGFFQQAAQAHPLLSDRVSGAAIPTSVDVIRELIEIETANYVDQYDPALAYPKSYLNRIDCMLEMGRSHMSNPARDAFASMREGVALRTRPSATFRLAYGD